MARLRIGIEGPELDDGAGRRVHDVHVQHGSSLPAPAQAG